jgi:hypothetical protein
MTTRTIPAPQAAELHRRVHHTPRAVTARTVKYVLLVLFLTIVLMDGLISTFTPLCVQS